MIKNKNTKIFIIIFVVILVLTIVASFVFDFNANDTDNLLSATSIIRALIISFSSAFFSLIMGMALGYGIFMWAHAKPRVIAVLDKIQGFFTLIPTTTWLIFCFYVVFGGNARLGYIACVFALSLCLAFTVRGEFVTAVSQVTTGEKEVAVSMGYTDKQILRYILLPQAIPNVLDSMSVLCRFHVKDTSLLGLVYVADVQYLADHVQAETTVPAIPIIVAAVFYIALCYAFSEALIYIKDNLHYGRRTKEEILERVMRGQV